MAITWKKVITTADDSTYLNTQVTNATVIGKVLTGLSTSSTADVAATDTIIVGMGKLEARVALNDDKVTDAGQTSNVTHTGEVTGSGALTIADDVIVNANINSSAAIAYSKLNLTGLIVNADLGTEEVKSTNFDGIASNPTVGNYFKAAASGAIETSAFPTTISSAQASAIAVNSTHAASSHAPSGANANVSGDSGNSAIYDNSGTPTLKSGITQAEMQTAIGGTYTDTNTDTLWTGVSTNLVAATAITSLGLGNVAVKDGGIGSTDILQSNGTMADNDFLRIDGTAVEGRSSDEVLSDLGLDADLKTLTITASATLQGSNTGDTSISDAINSTSSTTRASSTAVKAAYDHYSANTDVNVSVPNLKAALVGPFASNVCTIGGTSDTITIGDDLKVTGDLIVEGDTVTTNVTTIQTEDKSITLADHASPTVSTGNASGIDVMTSGTASEHPYVQWGNGGDLSGWTVKHHDGAKGTISTMNFHATAAPVDGGSGTVAQGVGSFYFEKDAGNLYLRTE